jgi:FMN phosphatase YigB (HAD superfamily)
MAEVPIRTIVFDIGRVLIRIDVAKAKAGLAKGLPLSPDELWSAIEHDPRWQDWQEGRMSAHDWHTNLCARLGVSLNFADFTKVWNDALDPAPIHPNSFFEGLSKHYKLGLLSNTDPIHVAKLESSYEFFRHFPPETRTYSCVVGCSKPSPLIYREALKACKARADQTLYIDDIPSYAEAARKLGLRGIVFQSGEQLRRELATLGVELQD